jgi:O-antigen/teichoic acid export membrane protein
MSFYRQTGYMGVGLILSGIGGLIMNIGLGRVLSGAEYGTFRVFFSAVLIVGWVLVFGVERDITARLSGGKSRAKAIGATVVFTLFLSGGFITAVALIHPRLVPVFGAPTMLVPFVAGTLAFVGYRYSMGLLKGYGLMKHVGLQNVFLGIGKAAIVFCAAAFGWQAFESSLFITATFVTVTALGLLCVSSSISSIQFGGPSRSLIQRVTLSSSKQVGDVIVKFGGPIIVPVIGGSSLEAGIFGGALTLAFIPFYGYNAIINNILPEVSALNSEGDAEGIGRRVGFLLEISAVSLLLWVAFGAVAGPSLVPFVFQPTFEISTVGSFAIFFLASAVIVSSLLTEVLIGIDAQRAVGRAWITPTVCLPVAAVAPWSPITATGITLAIYVTAVICLLVYALRASNVPLSWTGFDYTVFQ